MERVKITVKPLVDHVVRRCDEHRNQGAGDERPDRQMDLGATEKERENNSGHDKDVLGRVIEPHDGNIIGQLRRPRSRRRECRPPQQLVYAALAPSALETILHDFLKSADNAIAACS
jgi:hypothetical protein